MKTLDISFNMEEIKLNETEKKHIQEIGYVGLFENFLVNALTTVYQGGLPLDKGRVYGRVQRAMDALSPEDKELKLEDAEFDLVRETFKNPQARFHPNQYRIVNILLDNIEKAG